MITLTPENLIKYIYVETMRSTKQLDLIYHSQENQHLNNVILFIHTFTGCDTVISIVRKGKKKLLNIFNKNDQLSQHVEEIYKPQASAEAIKLAIKKILFAL